MYKTHQNRLNRYLKSQRAFASGGLRTRPPNQIQPFAKWTFSRFNHLTSIVYMNVSMLSNHVLKFECYLQICTKKAWITNLFAKRLQLVGDFVPWPLQCFTFQQIKQFPESNI